MLLCQGPGMPTGTISRFVALGDSTTEGLEDPYANGCERCVARAAAARAGRVTAADAA